MMAMWTARSRREKLLLTVAAFILAIACGVQFVFMPLHAARETAAASVAQGRSTLLRLEKLEAQGAEYVTIEIGTGPEIRLEHADRWATDSGLIRMGEYHLQEANTFEFEPADPAQVFSWTERVERELGLKVQSAQLISAGEGRITAKVVLSEAAPQ